MGIWLGAPACRREIAASAYLQNSQEFGKRAFKSQNSYSVSSARHTFSKILENSGNNPLASQNPYGFNLAKLATTIRSGTGIFAISTRQC